MVGKYNIRISSKKVVYEFDVKRKYTIIKGDSSTGKTYLYNMVNSPSVDKVCKREDGGNVPIIALPKVKNAYTIILEQVKNNVIIIDEGVEDFDSNEFIKLLQESDNYFIIITRKKLSHLPISINEIYRIEYTKKYNNINRMYIQNVLKNYYPENDFEIVSPDLFITEDSGSGYEFFSKVLNCNCISANGNANVVNTIINIDEKIYSTVCVIVDGAAYGAFVEDTLSVLQRKKINIKILIPESFEYLLLQSSIIQSDSKVLLYSYNYCDKTEFNKLTNGYDTGNCNFESWEQLYTFYLQYLSAIIQHPYSKKRGRLDKFYLRAWGGVKKYLKSLK